MPSQTHNQRFVALEKVSRREPIPFIAADQPFQDYFGERVFTFEKMKNRLPLPVFDKLMATIDKHEKLGADVADAVAHAAFEWAVEQGATHFCHWFQPQTGTTAEKHDSFLTLEKNQALQTFTGSQLMQSEPDASSFPSGGLRATHSARGYTSWDPSSPMFINLVAGAKTLCIPSVFVSYTGEALDDKVGLMRSGEAVHRHAIELLALLGDPGVTRVVTSLGAEQEYFLVDKAYAAARPDLVMCGRTLLGARPPRGQQLEDHYFGKIPTRVQAFMAESENVLCKLGVPVKTRHNEVAPAQFETAPIFEITELASDHNQVTMATLERVAEKHNFKILFHEKPFGGLNGSGKHCNWSVAVGQHDGTFKGSRNLLEPGENPQENLRFLAFLVCTLRGVNKHAGLMRAAIASAGNDFRLGANEAPPAIISAFLGEQLTAIVDAIAEGKTATQNNQQDFISLSVSKLADVRKDKTDRNRTSPFAFTGNKFEFRAVGGSAPVAFPMTFLNAAIADGISEFVTALKANSGGNVTKESILKTMQQFLKVDKRVCFDGNGYSQEWVQEAERRGLPHLRKTPESLKELISEQTIDMLQRMKVFSVSETKSRYHVRLEDYLKRVGIEVETMSHLVTSYVLPPAYQYLNELVEGGVRCKELGIGAPQVDEAKSLVAIMKDLETARVKFESLRKKAAGVHDEEALANVYAEELLPAMADLRTQCDALETSLPDSSWMLPKYREMLFVY